MAYRNSHVSDQDLILAADGELPRRRTAELEAHLNSCGRCRARRKAMEDSIENFVHACRDTIDSEAAPPRIPRALLKARLSQLAAERPPTSWERLMQFGLIGRRAVYTLGVFVLALAIVLFWPSPPTSLALSPDPVLTPGVTLPVSEADLCEKQPAAGSHLVRPTLGKRVFEQYGIRNPPPRYYEMDYLIDPDLGGADDARNLWPQPYSVLWNANVKDALEHHLRELVCSEQITLAQAQRDISVDWISAYKRYFHADHPLPNHQGFRKDQPWE